MAPEHLLVEITADLCGGARATLHYGDTYQLSDWVGCILYADWEDEEDFIFASLTSIDAEDVTPARQSLEQPGAVSFELLAEFHNVDFKSVRHPVVTLVPHLS